MSHELLHINQNAKRTHNTVICICTRVGRPHLQLSIHCCRPLSFSRADDDATLWWKKAKTIIATTNPSVSPYTQKCILFLLFVLEFSVTRS